MGISHDFLLADFVCFVTLLQLQGIYNEITQEANQRVVAAESPVVDERLIVAKETCKLFMKRCLGEFKLRYFHIFGWIIVQVMLHM